MREIKFRGLNANNEFVYGWLLQNVKPIGERSIIGTMEIHQPYGDWNEDFEVYDESVGQFTGLTDCNGVEIYDGDLLYHHKQGVREVIYPMSESFAGFGLRSAKGMMNTLQDAAKLYEVVGNIHQNPELLERNHA